MLTTTNKKVKKRVEDPNNVKPLKTIEEIKDMIWALGRHCTRRDQFLFIFGVHTGLRISDILKLSVKDVKNKTHVTVIEKKTGKVRMVLIEQIKEEINDYIRDMDPESSLFPSRKGGNPITTTQAYRALVKAGEMLDRDDIGTHTMRKTFGLHYYKKTKDVYNLMELFNHSAPSITKRYIGIRQEELDESLAGFKLY